MMLKDANLMSLGALDFGIIIDGLVATSKDACSTKSI